MNINMFKSLDFFSPPVELNIAGDSSFRTFQGLLFTILYCSVMFLVILWEANSYLRTDIPLSVHDAFQRSEYPKVMLQQSKMSPIFFGYSTEVDMILANETARYFTFSTIKVSWVTTTSDAGDITLEKRIKHFDTIPCAELPEDQLREFDYMGTDNYVYQMIPDYGVCIKGDEEYFVNGKGSDEVFEVVTFRIMPCSLDPSECATKEEMGKANFVLALPSSNFDASNYKNPHSYVTMADDIYYINPNIRQIYGTKVRENQVLDYLGVFDQDWVLRLKFFDFSGWFTNQAYRDGDQLSCTPADAYDPNSSCSSYFELYMQSSGGVSVFKRSYVTLLNVFGDLGGINGIVSFLIIILYQPINHYLRRKFIRKHIYSFIDHKKIDLNSKKGESSSIESITSPQYDRKCSIELQGGKQKEEQTAVNKTHMSFSEAFKPQEVPKVEERKSRFGCCRKKTPEELERLKLEKSASEQVISYLDVLNIIKDLSMLKVLIHLLMRSRHIGLAPLLGFKAWNHERSGMMDEPKDKTPAIMRRKNKQGSVSPFSWRRKKKRCCCGNATNAFKMPIEEEEEAYQHWMTQLEQANHLYNKENPVPINSSNNCNSCAEDAKMHMDELLDGYYRKQLLGMKFSEHHGLQSTFQDLTLAEKKDHEELEPRWMELTPDPLKVHAQVEADKRINQPSTPLTNNEGNSLLNKVNPFLGPVNTIKSPWRKSKITDAKKIKIIQNKNSNQEDKVSKPTDAFFNTQAK